MKVKNYFILFLIILLSSSALACHNTLTQYANETKTTSIKEQCGPTCFIESPLAVLEDYILNTTGNEINISRQYVVSSIYNVKIMQYFKLLSRIFLSGKSNYPPFEPGDNSEFVLLTLQNIGFLYESDLPTNPQTLYSILEQYNDIIIEFKKALSLVKNKAELSNLLVKYLIRLDATQSYAISSQMKDQEKYQKAKYNHDQLKISINHRSYIPKDMIIKEKIDITKDNLFLNNQDTRLLNQKLIALKNKSQYKDLIMENHDAGNSVTINLYWLNDFTDYHSGKMIIPTDYKIFDFSPFKTNENAHSMKVVAYSTKNGKLEWVKVKNSHGKKSGDNGFMHIHVSYLNALLAYIEVYQIESTKSWEIN